MVRERPPVTLLPLQPTLTLSSLPPGQVLGIPYSALFAFSSGKTTLRNAVHLSFYPVRKLRPVVRAPHVQSRQEGNTEAPSRCNKSPRHTNARVRTHRLSGSRGRCLKRGTMYTWCCCCCCALSMYLLSVHGSCMAGAQERPFIPRCSTTVDEGRSPISHSQGRGERKKHIPLWYAARSLSLSLTHSLFLDETKRDRTKERCWGIATLKRATCNPYLEVLSRLAF